MVEWWWLIIVSVGSSFVGLLTAGLMNASHNADAEMERMIELDKRNQLCNECKENLLAEFYSRQGKTRP